MSESGPYLTPEHRLFRQTLRSYLEANASVREVWEWDRTERFPEQLYRGLADLGVLGLTFDERYGGNLADEFTMCIVAEELARVGAFLLYAYMPTVSFSAKSIFRYGTEEQKRNILPVIARGEMRIAMGLTEPEAGSDLASLSSRAEKRGETYFVTGQKVFTTGADQAHYILALVRTESTAPLSKGLSVFLVPTDAHGLTIRTLRKLAGQATHTCEVFMENVPVSIDMLLGGDASRGRGLQMMLEMLDAERIYVAAQAVGMAQRALDWAIPHARNRVQFGKPIYDQQAIAHMLADIDIETEAARTLTYGAAWRLQNDMPCSREASIAKVFATEAASRNISRAMQILGGYSYIAEYGIERLYRECKLNEIAGGTNQILRNIVAKHLRAKTSSL